MNPADTLPNLLINLQHHLSPRRQRQFGLLMALMLLSAFAEVVSLGAILPFLGVLVAPDRVFNYLFVADIARIWGINSADQLVIPLTVTFAAAALMACSIRIFLLWSSNQLAFSCGADLSIEVYKRTLYQDYRVHIARNTSEVISSLTNKINSVVFGVLLPSLTLISSTLLMVAIMLTLIAIDPMVASVATVGFGSSYMFITLISRRRLKSNSKRIAHEQTKVIKALQEGLGGIRDVLIDGSQQVYCDIYKKADRLLRRAQSDNAFVGGSPRHIMEALGMVLIAFLAAALIRQNDGLATALPVLGALALGAQRLLPAMQQIYAAWASIAGNHASLVDIISLLNQPMPAELLQPSPAPLPFKNSIRFNAVYFCYTKEAPPALKDINLLINKGARVGIVGATGSGKSTMLDLLMGLLLPTDGELSVDDQLITGHRLRAWQRTIAHVPQSIYLADTTLAENIAFGVPHEMIDPNRIQQAARQAHIAEFIESNPKGYQAHVGERGIRLSGGQRQRIGIARALYKEASVLVFDEATSALDNSTEQSVMEAIEELSDNLTILLIAHRLTTVRHCDTIIELERGRVVAQGTYEELLECSPSFRSAAMMCK